MNEAPTTNNVRQRSVLRTVLLHGSFILVSVALLSLGLWQLNRAEEKRTMLSLEVASARLLLWH